MKMQKSCLAVLLIIVLVLQNSGEICVRENMYLRRKNQYYSYNYDGMLGHQNMAQKEGEYSITYFLNGGVNSISNPSSFAKKNLPIRLGEPYRDGYTFAGWYTDSNFKTRISIIAENVVGNYTIYAKWNEEIDDEYNVQMYPYSSTLATENVKKLKNCNYEFLSHIVIPGMPSTRERDAMQNRITDISSCPQGICMTDDYMLISAYSSGKGALGCLHVFDKATGEYLVTLGMKEESHLGGLTFDGENIWVCHSNNNTLEAIPYVFVKRLAERRTQTVIDCSTLFEEYHLGNKPSCITYYNGVIWVASYKKVFHSTLAAYKITETGLQLIRRYRIPSKVQGIAFGEEGKVYLSTSLGRTKSSYLKVYDSVKDMDENPNYPQVKIEMPPCSEEIALVDNSLLILFESASQKYLEGTDGKGKSIAPIDEILALHLNNLD